MRLRIIAHSLLVTTLIMACLLSPVRNASAAKMASIPIKIAILTDNGYPSTDNHSSLYSSLCDVLIINRIPFDTLDISEFKHDSLLTPTQEPKYATLAIMSPGWRMPSYINRAIIDASASGMGFVALLPDSVNANTMKLFGIEKAGSEWMDSKKINIEKDVFTYSYRGKEFTRSSGYLNHTVSNDASIVARFDEGDPAIWTYENGRSKAVFHNHTDTARVTYRGILLQSILYAMPVGVASPVNAGVIEVDGFPKAFYNEQEVQQYYYDFFTNFRDWLELYDLKASFYISFSYSGNVSDFWIYPESLKAAHEILADENEIGLQNAGEYIPLDFTYLNDSDLNAEIDKIKTALERLSSTLNQKYDDKPLSISSYVAPNNRIGEEGYELLANLGIRYVGTSDMNGASTQERDKHSAEQTILPTMREFGWEGDIGIYNIPRNAGGFFYFHMDNNGTLPSEQSWGNLMAAIESGESYLIFTSADSPLQYETSVNLRPTLEEIFESYVNWADFVRLNYPFYRWWTATELGDYLTSQNGTISAVWFPDNATLRVTPAQSLNTLHVKTDRLLSSIFREGGSLVLQFSDTSANVISAEYDIIRSGNDYFLYTKGNNNVGNIELERPFVFSKVTPAEPIKPSISDQETPPDVLVDVNLAQPETNISNNVSQDIAISNSSVLPQPEDQYIPSPASEIDASRDDSWRKVRLLGIGEVPVEIFTSFALGSLLFILGITLVIAKRRTG